MAVTVEHRPDLILIRLTEAVSVDYLYELAGQLDEIDQLTPGLPRLADATDITAVRVDFAAMFEFADRRKRQGFAGDVRTAILVASNVGFGCARMFETLLQHPQVTVEVFRDREAALAWLGAGPTRVGVPLSVEQDEAADPGVEFKFGTQAHVGVNGSILTVREPTS
jgi:hypothetical protein